MTKHNEDILNCLNDYLKVSKPAYAVLLKGAWGCGKTYFIKNWMEALKAKKNDNEEFFTLDPIYVSLYGMTSTGQIEAELKRAVSPILHSKAMKMAGKVFKVAISAALRYNIDLNNNDEADMRMECTIDPKALLGSDDPHVKGTRLLVFDDLERSNMNMKDVLGYINYYVEHIGCSVVIVGDCTTDGHILLNPRLICAPRCCIEYVITHELCHLIYRSHNKDFYTLLTKEMPHWEKWKNKLERIMN